MRKEILQIEGMCLAHEGFSLHSDSSSKARLTFGTTTTAPRNIKDTDFLHIAVFFGGFTNVPVHTS